VNLSIADLSSGRNLFEAREDPRGLGFSRLAYSAVGGLLRHAGAICALGAPTVNSYKRLVPKGALPDISWAPTLVAYGDNNRSCMLRLPRSRRCVENRSTDISCNPYLVLALHVAAALEGIAEELDPGAPCVEDTFRMTGAERRARGWGALPRSLIEAAEALGADPLAREVLGDELHRDWVAAKLREWDEFHTRVSDWERDRYLQSL
jgi:glutamine synthetase